MRRLIFKCVVLSTSLVLEFVLQFVSKMGAKRITSPVKKLIIAAVNSKKTYSEVAALYGVGKTAVCRIVNRFKKEGAVNHKSRPGRPKKTSIKDDKLLERLCRLDPRKNAVMLRKEIRENYNIDLSLSSVKRRLNTAKLYGRRPSKKPLISLKSRLARVEFAKKHLKWTVQDWSKVLWSDESKFMMFGNDAPQFVRRPPCQRFHPKYQLPTVKHGGGNIMVWGCFSRDGVGPIHQIDGIMDRFVYKNIVNSIMLPHAKDKMARGWIFQQDNDPKHTSGVVKDNFKTKKVRLLDWPSRSPDLNPIEHLWEHIGRQFRDFHPPNKADLFKKIEEIWSEVPLDVLIKLVDSMPRRCQAVIDSKGYATKY